MPKKYVMLRIPEESWELLCETLYMDSESNNFSTALRGDLKKALDQIEYCGEDGSHGYDGSYEEEDDDHE